jgi:hypothetical protein
LPEGNVLSLSVGIHCPHRPNPALLQGGLSSRR